MLLTLVETIRLAVDWFDVDAGASTRNEIAEGSVPKLHCGGYTHHSRAEGEAHAVLIAGGMLDSCDAGEDDYDDTNSVAELD